MKEIKVRRTADCPTGEHVESRDNPDDPTKPILVTVDCDCPWLVIRESHPVPHVMVWNTPEAVQRLIKEFDEGYFDHVGMPQRVDSRFVSPHVSKVLELIKEGDALGAAMRLLATVVGDQVRWIASTSTLAVRVPFDRGTSMDRWLLLSFEPGERIKVDRGPLPEEAEPHFDMIEWKGTDLFRVGIEPDQIGPDFDEASLLLWRTDYTSGRGAAIARLAQGLDIPAELLTAGIGGGWQAAPPAAPGYQEAQHVPPQEGDEHD